MEKDIHVILQSYWGYDTYRPLQEEIIRSVLAGKDTLALLPTGSGKSVCYQVPALAKEGVCLVISPLIALMKDQVQQLQKKGIPALALHTGMSYREITKSLELAVNGKIKLLYLSPERLQTRVFRDYLAEMPLNLVAIDEAHCVSQWGYDFRPSYLQIASLRESLTEIPFLALTASATPTVQEDILRQLKISNGNILKGSFAREGLSYSCFEEVNKQQKLLHILQQVDGCGIVYCKSRKRTAEISRFLEQQGISATYYHAGLNQEERQERQHNWTNNNNRIMVSTNAFGMGIDKPDVRVVVHFDTPDCLENYYQEAGRAGRDQKKAYAVLLYNKVELEDFIKQINKKYPEITTIRQIYQSLANFLQIPAGAGSGESFEFDLSLFCQNFTIDRQVAISTLQILQADGFCSLNDSVFVPSKLQFIATRVWLDEFEIQYPHLEPLIKALLRNYEGIFSYPANISEFFLARLLKTDTNKIFRQLEELHHHGIVDFVPLKDQPQLIFLTERVKTDQLQINEKALAERKRLAKERAGQFVNFIHSTDCRSRFIGKYFGDPAVPACGICDICLQLKKKGPGIEQISEAIIIVLKLKPQNLSTLKTNLPFTCGEEQLWQALNFLLSEEIVKMESNGFFSIN